MPAVTDYGVDLLVELAVGRAVDAGLWGSSRWGQARWGDSDTEAGDWLEVTCDLADELRLTAGSNTSDGVTRRWESASASFTLLGRQWDPWNGPHKGIIGDRTPVRISWRPQQPAPVVRTNLASNPSFETNLTGWTGTSTSLARVATNPAAGTSSCRATNTAASATVGDVRLTGGGGASFPPGITAGRTYTFTATCTTPAAHAGLLTDATSRQRRVLLFYSTPTQTNVPLFGPQGPNVAGTFTLSHTFTVPADAVGAILGVGCAGSPTDPAFVTYLDAVLLEQAPAAGTYFDGSTPDTPTTDYAWTGPAHASTSTATTAGVPAWVRAFTGYVATRGYSWDADEQEAGVACVDGTSVLVASDGVARPLAGAGESAAARVQRIAAAALWPGPYDVTAGGTPLQGTTLDDPAWDELLAVADTDLALLWVNRAGALAYRPRGRVGQGVRLAGRLAVCEAGPGDVGVMTMGRNQPSVTRNRVAIARKVDDTIPGDAPAIAQLDDRQSIARYQAHDFKRTDLWHRADAWSTTVAQAVLGAGAWPSPAPGQLLMDSITGDARVAGVLLALEPDQTFDVVDDAGTVWREAVVGWDVQVTRAEIEGVLLVEDVTRWTSVAHWGTGRWGVDRWGIGGI